MIKKLVIFLSIIILFIGIVNADIIEISYATGTEVTFETIGSESLGWWAGYCGDLICNSALEQSLCPLDCGAISVITTITGGAAGATEPGPVCPYGQVLVGEKCVLLEQIQEIITQPEQKNLFQKIKINSTFIYIITGVFVLLLIYRRARRRGINIQKKKKEEEERRTIG